MRAVVDSTSSESSESSDSEDASGCLTCEDSALGAATRCLLPEHALENCLQPADSPSLVNLPPRSNKRSCAQAGFAFSDCDISDSDLEPCESTQIQSQSDSGALPQSTVEGFGVCRKPVQSQQPSPTSRPKDIAPFLNRTLGSAVLQPSTQQCVSVQNLVSAIPRGSWARPATLLAPRPGWQTHNRWVLLTPSFRPQTLAFPRQPL